MRDRELLTCVLYMGWLWADHGGLSIEYREKGRGQALYRREEEGRTKKYDMQICIKLGV